jgi:phosphoenolpyruvate carboxykinase (GTP)
LKIINAAAVKPIFAHVNWFQRDPDDGHFLWPGYRDNLRPLLWLMQLRDGEVTGERTAVGVLPTKDELQLDGCEVTESDLASILSIELPRWQQEAKFRAEHLEQFGNLPDEIWAAHRRVAAALDGEPA